MKKILIIAYHFAPNNSIGSIRPTKLSLYFSKLGYEVTVIRAKNESIADYEMNKDLKDIKQIITIRHSFSYKLFLNLLEKIRGINNKKNKEKVLGKRTTSNVKHERKATNFKLRIKKNLAGIKPLLRDYDFNNKAFREFENNKLDFSSFDAVISTYNIMGNHLIAKRIKKLNPNIKWIADFRDPVVTPEKKETIRSFIYERITSDILKECDHIVAVSEGYLEMITGGDYSNKSHVIYNGYDPSENSELKKISQANDKLTFVYTGVLYGGKRDLSPLFKAISLLIKRKKIEKSKIEIIYAGKEKAYFDFMVDKFDLLKNTISHDYLPRTDALKIQYSSDLLIVATWNFSDYYGVIPGKFTEYMNANKKIIGLVEGNQKGSELKKIIQNNKLGFCFERVNEEQDFASLCAFIENEYNKKFDFVKDYKEDNKFNKFSYVNITQEMINLINS